MLKFTPLLICKKPPSQQEESSSKKRAVRILFFFYVIRVSRNGTLQKAMLSLERLWSKLHYGR